MAEKCPICGKKVGGLMGVAAPEDDKIAEGKIYGVYVEGMCFSCLYRRNQEIKLNNNIQSAGTKNDISERILTALDKVFISASSIPNEMEDLGLVTGYCIMGTGPISAIASSITDMFGQKSNAYLEKVRLAEVEALNMLKVEALKKGADAVYCCRVSLAEATSGHGMLMVSASGSAVKTGKADKDFEEAWKVFADSTPQKE